VERLVVRVPGGPQQAEAEGEAVGEAGEEPADRQSVAERCTVGLADHPDPQRLLPQRLAGRLPFEERVIGQGHQPAEQHHQ
jgi:hypothetical protein